MKYFQKGFVVIGLSYFIYGTLIVGGAIALDQHLTTPSEQLVSK